MLKRILGHAAAGLDRTVGASMFRKRRRTRSAPESLGHDSRLRVLEAIRAEYDRAEHFSDPDSFFPRPGRPSFAMSKPRRRRSATGPVGVVDCTWTSTFEPFSPDMAHTYLRHVENRGAAARLFLHDDRPRPMAILIHGYRWGEWAFEERIWPVQSLLDRGLDVALPVLPFHAMRARRFAPPLFPSSDPRFTNEGFRQAISDLRALLAMLRDRGAPAVGLMGMSLGAYTSALLATLDDGLAFAVPIIPVASLSDVARRSGRLVGTEHERALQYAALEAALRVVSPLSRTPLLAPDRVLVIGAEADRIAPVEHARRLAGHFSAPLETIHGGHLLQFGRGEAFRSIGRLLGRLGLVG